MNRDMTMCVNKGSDYMELSEAIRVLNDWNKAEEWTIKDPDYRHKDVYIERKEAIETVLQVLEELQKENELARKSLIENSNIADERNDLLVEVQKLKKENEELKTDTRNRAIGCRDLVKKCKDCTLKECIGCEYVYSDLKETMANSISKDKIKEKIEEQTERVNKVLEELLKDKVDKSTGCIILSYLSKKEREEIINKRNCLLVQRATLQQVKEELLKGETK